MSKKIKKAINLWNQNPNRPLFLFTEQEKVFRETGVTSQHFTKNITKINLLHISNM
jgi:hypothetical protein